MPRKDLAKTFSEHERIRSKDKFHFHRSREKQKFKNDPEGSGGLLTPSRIYGKGWNCKESRDNFKPLNGFLKKAVGRHWDDVYSELKHLLKKNTAVNKRALEHIEWRVMKSVRIDIDGEVRYLSLQSGRWEPLSTSWRGEFYVHPHTGILCKVQSKGWRRQAEEREEKKRAELAKTFRRIDTHHAYQKIDGVWYHITYAIYPCQQKTVMVPSSYDTRVTYPQTRFFSPYCYDVVKKQTVGGDVTQESAWASDNKTRIFKVPVVKRQCTTKEIRTQKL